MRRSRFTFYCRAIEIQGRFAIRQHQKSEGLFRAFAEQAADAFFVHDMEEGRILYANPSACRSLGYSREELLKKRVTDIEAKVNVDLERHREFWDQLEEGTSLSVEGLHRRKDGTCFPVDVSASLVQLEDHNVILAVARDITERKRVEENLQRVRFSVDNARDAIYWIDSQARLVYVNAAACEALGFSRQELLTKTVFDIDPVFPREGWEAHWKKTSELGSFVFETVHQAGDGRRIPVEVAISFMRFAEVNYHCAYVRDITERKREEREREDLIRELECKNAELEQKNEELERYAYTVSHDLKNPLLTIRLFSGKVRRGLEQGATDELAAGLSRIDTAALKMHRLLEDLLELSRIGRVMDEAEPVALDGIVQETLASLAEAVESSRAQVTVTPGLPEVWGHRTRLSEVFQNLIENAIKFSSEQDPPRVEVGGQAEDGIATCWVSDNGPGIDPRYHEKIFGLFERLNPRIDGTGIGLALVRRIIEVHGGKCWVESAGAGRGSRFFLTIPCAEVQSPAAG